jgi:hypothetical protein
VLNEELIKEPIKPAQSPEVAPEKGQSTEDEPSDNDSMASRLLAAKRKNKPKS